MYQGGGAKQIRVVRVSLGPVHERPEPTSEAERENGLRKLAEIPAVAAINFGIPRRTSPRRSRARSATNVFRRFF